MRIKQYAVMTLCLLFIIATLGGCGSMPGKEQVKKEYPSHQIKLIVPFAPGGGTDLHARALQKMVAKYMGQSLLVLNKPGGGANIGLTQVASSDPDGYTWGFSIPEIIFHSVYGTSKYHYLTALDPVAQISSLPLLLVVNADSAWYSVDDVVRYAKEQNKVIKFASNGIGSVSHVFGEVFVRSIGAEGVQVPFRGGSEKVTMLLGNHVDMIYASPTAVKEYVKAGRLRVLASTGSKRLAEPLFADVPTFKELGMDIEFNNWYGICTPKPLPLDVKAKIASDLKKMILDPEFKAAVETLGTQLDYLGPEECQEKWIEDTKRLKKMVTETGILEQVRAIQGTSDAK